MTSRYGYAGALLLLLACGGQTLDMGWRGAGGSGNSASGGIGGSGSLGEGATGCTPQPGVNTNAGSGPAPYLGDLPGWRSDEACTPVPTELQGEWTGYVQGQSRFPENGTLQLSLGAGGESACGKLTFGEAQSYPAATDPTAAYPAGVELQRWQEPAALPGYAYSLVTSTASAGRLQLSINLNEPWRSWCQLQAPECSGKFGGYQCLRSMSWQNNGDGTCNEVTIQGRVLGPVSCAQVNACADQLLCLCTKNECDANVQTHLVELDLHIEGDAIEGQVDQNVIYLKKAPGSAE